MHASAAAHAAAAAPATRFENDSAHATPASASPMFHGPATTPSDFCDLSFSAHVEPQVPIGYTKPTAAPTGPPTPTSHMGPYPPASPNVHPYNNPSSYHMTTFSTDGTPSDLSQAFSAAPTYGGSTTGSQAEMWLQHYEKVTDIYLLTPCQKLKLALAKLTGTASMWAESKHFKSTSDWVTFRREFLARFGTRPEVLLQLLYNTMQQEDEPAAEYAERLATIQMRLSSHVTHTDFEQKMQFIRGLLQPLQRQVIVYRPATLAAAIEHAVYCDTFGNDTMQAPPPEDRVAMSPSPPKNGPQDYDNNDDTGGNGGEAGGEPPARPKGYKHHRPNERGPTVPHAERHHRRDHTSPTAGQQVGGSPQGQQPDHQAPRRLRPNGGGPTDELERRMKDLRIMRAEPYDARLDMNYHAGFEEPHTTGDVHYETYDDE